jgi:hypothetical protein
MKELLCVIVTHFTIILLGFKQHSIAGSEQNWRHSKPADTSSFNRIILIKEDSNKDLEIYNEILQTLGFVSVIITLIYLSKQNRLASRNNILGSFQHVYNHLNDFNVAINQSGELAEIIIKGRQSYTTLHRVEQLRFEHTYGWLANILEGWLMLIQESKMSGTFKEAQVKNIKSIIDVYFSYNGVQEFWSGYQTMYSQEICALINQTLQRHAESERFDIS